MDRLGRDDRTRACGQRRTANANCKYNEIRRGMSFVLPRLIANSIERTQHALVHIKFMYLM